MGVLAPHLRTLDRSARLPIDTSRNFPAHISAEPPLNISPNFSEVKSFGTLGKFLKYLAAVHRRNNIRLGGADNSFTIN
jgi:hypothetical protein